MHFSMIKKAKFESQAHTARVVAGMLYKVRDFFVIVLHFETL